MVASSLGSTSALLGVAGGFLVLVGASVLFFVGAPRGEGHQGLAHRLGIGATRMMRWLLGR